MYSKKFRELVGKIAEEGDREAAAEIARDRFLDVDGVKREAAATEREYILNELEGWFVGEKWLDGLKATDLLDFIRKLPVP